MSGQSLKFDTYKGGKNLYFPLTYLQKVALLTNFLFLRCGGHEGEGIICKNMLI